MRNQLFALIGMSAVSMAAQAQSNAGASLDELSAMSARFAPVELRIDLASFPANERLTLTRLVQAATILDPLFMRQMSALNETRLLELLKDDSPLGQARTRYFVLNKGPWSQLDEDKPFLPGVETKPDSGNFYPAGATRADVEAWLNGLQGAEGDSARGFFTTIRRSPSGAFIAVPYSLEYQGELAEVARLLREAAAATTQPTLKAFLSKRAEALVSNDYYASDMAWMELDATIEPTIGPYEVYEDKWFNFKAAFEAFIVVTDSAETDKLARFGKELQELEDHLPIEPQYRRPKLGGLAPIRVGDVVFSSGDGNHGVQTAAFNLPNDERVVQLKGSKRVMLKNTQEAKFNKVLLPISRIALAADDQPHVAFEPFFTHILMHELMHGLGPQTIKVQGRDTTVRQELKELNGPLEEAKADISGLWALQYLMDKGVLPKAEERNYYATFLASTFRTLRFGLQDAHAKGMALQFNWLIDKGGFVRGKDGKFAVDFKRVKQGVSSLTHEIMTIQATGDYARAKALLEEMVVIRPEVKEQIEQLKGVPIDIAPKFVTAEELLASAPK